MVAQHGRRSKIKMSAMHTRDHIDSTDFTFLRTENGTEIPCRFEELFADYHELDRIAFVSPTLAQGVRDAGASILAFSSQFYSSRFKGGKEIIDYPHHFAILGAGPKGVHSKIGEISLDDDPIRPVWGNLDVWPQSNWITSPANTADFLEAIFNLQINRVFWPAALTPERPTRKLPNYMHDIMLHRIKSVTFYKSTRANFIITGSKNASNLIAKSLQALPMSNDAQDLINSELDLVEKHRLVSAQIFIEEFKEYFSL